ncbi:MAG: hypothetical protein LBL58_00100 [Tannerellaceae bacterium]|jgi:hypothetical protein|nr:hypothetical protein [Tannerellaceae bacterium]
MMKKIIGIVTCLLLIGFSLNAQDDKKSKINSIKKSDKYIYAEATQPTLDEAYVLAEEILHSNINEWVEQNKKMKGAQNIILRNTSDEWNKVDLPRGDMYRAFIYVAKADIIPADNVTVLEKTTDNIPVVTEEETFSEETVSVIPADILTEILGIRLFEDIEPCLVKLKREDKITDYNKYASIKEVKNYCMIVYNREGRIEALLSAEKDERINLRTNEADNLANYKGCGAICFKIKE